MYNLYMMAYEEYMDKIIFEDYDYILVGIGREWDALQPEADVEKLHQAYRKLQSILQGKNYYAVTMNYDDVAAEYFDEKHLVAPCGSMKRYQCVNGCASIFGDSPEDLCPQCGGHMVPNNITCDKYNENGYLADWGKYTKWLEYTLNRKLLILELGADFFAPSVIRWPFERVAFYNQKATFVRVHATFEQLPENLKELDRVHSLKKNSVQYVLADTL